MVNNEGITVDGMFLEVFQAISEKLKFTAPAIQQLKELELDFLIQAATSKCVEFNLAANREGKDHAPSFLLVSNLRGICEDLICLTYLTRMENKRANELIWLKIRHDFLKGLLVQRRFFHANNPVQQVLVSSLTPAEEEQAVKAAQTELRRDWPTVKKLTRKLRLEFTYEYIYFATSNFVHFNPWAFLRTGWGSESGPFTFSIRNMDLYYRRFSSVYGAIMFIGFHAAFGVDYFSSTIDTEIDRLVELIGSIPRWPEIITFEEMNKQPPSNPLLYAVLKRMREENQPPPYDAILKEVLSLRQGS